MFFEKIVTSQHYSWALGSVLALFYYINPQNFGYFLPLLEIKGKFMTKFVFLIYINSIAKCLNGFFCVTLSSFIPKKG